MTQSVDEAELKRLNKLWSLGLLESGTEDRFDRITRMARRLFDLPVAIVGLIDDQEQWFKSSMGVDKASAPRAEVLCDITINQDQVLVIEDTLSDESYQKYAVVTGDPGVRFYAGYPLRVDGEKLGTLCVVDVKPRSFGKDDQQALKDLAGLVEEQLKLSGFAFTDELTQLLNRRGFVSSATHSMAFFRRHQIQAALVFVDLDNFKSINDTYGHAEGDAALSAVAGVMKDTFRECDLIARLGGDEFVALLPASSAEQAQIALKRLDEALSEFQSSSAKPYRLKFSSGISEFDPEGSDSIAELLEQADQLMYADKKTKI